MRGLHTLLLSRGPGPGFIPARAGSAAGSVELRAYPPVHPRPCGVCGRLGGAPRLPTGSSPPVRGLPKRTGGQAETGGFIPAARGPVSYEYPSYHTQ